MYPDANVFSLQRVLCPLQNKKSEISSVSFQWILKSGALNKAAKYHGSIAILKGIFRNGLLSSLFTPSRVNIYFQTI